MKSFLLNEKERELSLDEINAEFYKMEGRKPNYKEDFVKAIQSYAKRGEAVYFVFNGYKLRSNVISPNIDPKEYNYENAIIEVGPITSLKELEETVANLGDWRDPANRFAYLKVLLATSGMYERGFNINTNIMGIDGRFKGDYPYEIIDAMDKIIKKYFPAPSEIFDSKTKMLKPEFKGEDEIFYVYLGNATTEDGIRILGSNSKLENTCRELDMRFIGSISIEELYALTEEAKSYDFDSQMKL